MRKIWDIPGGIHPPENKRQSLKESIGELPLPEKLVLPLNQHLGAPAQPCVAVGEKVLKGQMIAEPAGFVSAAVHASSSGMITAIEERQIAHPSGMSSLCIEIMTDGQEQWIEHQGVGDYQSLEPAELLDTIRYAGIAGMGGAGFPSAIKLNPGPSRTIDTLIINATECEPYITADDALICERAEEIVWGIQILSYILGHPQHILIGIEDNKPKAYEALEPYLADSNIKLVEFPTKYPSGGEKQLIYILTGKEVPSGGLPSDIGIVCQNIGTVYAIKRAVMEGEPLISRVTTVTGEACGINRNYQTLIGTPVSHLLAHNQFDDAVCGRLVMGGPMMGFSLPSDSVPVVKTTNCILAPSEGEIPADELAQPCIRCGMCAEACPASLLPQQLFWYAQSHSHERLEAHNLFDCIECGACSYVCPSNIPLVQYFRAGKGEIRKANVERVQSDHARERFEFRQLRIEKAEQEKEAKRKARRAAAEKAKSSDKPGSSAEDIIKAAQARAAAKKASPEEQKAKLERAVTTAENRVKNAEEKLATASEESEEKRAVLEAGLVSARKKLDDARAKLTEASVADTASHVEQKMTADPRLLLEKKIDGLRQRIATTEEKIAAAEDDSLREALRSGLKKQHAKLAETEKSLAQLPTGTTAPQASPQEMDAASSAIAKAKAAAAARAEMSPEEKLRADTESLQKRLAKAQEKLAKAEAEESEHIEVLRTAADKLQQKLEQSQSRLAELID